jgi:hypothetical protein
VTNISISAGTVFQMVIARHERSRSNARRPGLSIHDDGGTADSPEHVVDREVERQRRQSEDAIVLVHAEAAIDVMDGIDGAPRSMTTPFGLPVDRT